MSILQISKIQQRSGNLVDLPQLDNAELGWASDANRLFIGKTSPNENVEVLTSYSNIYFSQINGSYGNLNINPVTLAAGELLTFDGTNWVNSGGTAGGNINLGNISNVIISGGASGYVLQTDGLGNLSWTPKTTLVAYLENVTKANPAVVTTVRNHNLTNGAAITITGAQGMTQLNGVQYYVGNLTLNTFSLYSDSGLTTTVNSASYTSYAFTSVSNTTTGTNRITVGNSAVLSLNSPVQFIGNVGNSGILANTTYYINSIPSGTSITVSNTIYANGTAGPIFALSTANGLIANVYQTGGQLTSISTGGSSGPGLVAGTDTQVQYNSGGSFGASSAFTFNYTNKILTVNGNANVGNLNASSAVAASTFSSGIGNGTAPLTVNSTTKVVNLNADMVDGFNTSTVTAANTITTRDANGSIAANVFSGNAFNISGNANVGNLGFGTGQIIGTGNVTAGNIIGTIVAGSNNITTSGNVTAGNVIGNLVNGTSKVSITNNANITLAAAGNNTLTITGTGTNISGTLNVTGIITGNGSGLTSLAGSSVNGAVPNATAANILLTNSSSSSTVYPTFVTSNANGFYSTVTASGINANLANSSITATTFVGTLSGSATYALSATNASALLQNTSTATTVYPTFTTSSANGNAQAVISTGISANLANNSITANTFIGTLIGTATGVGNATYTGITNQSTGIYYPVLASSSTTGNYALAANSGISANLANGALLATTFVGVLNGAATTAGTVTTNAQPNITSVGLLSGLTVGNATSNTQFGNGTINSTGNISAANITGNHFGNGSGITYVNASVVNGTVANANYALYAQQLVGGAGASTAVTVTANAQPNITSVGTLTSLIVGNSTSNTQFGNGTINASGNISAANITGNHFGNGSGITYINASVVNGSVSSANNATTAGTVTINAQPNITSVGTLNGLTALSAIFTANGIISTVDVTTPNTGSGTTGGLRLRGNLTTGNAIIQFTDSTATNEWSHITVNSSGTLAYSAAMSATGDISTTGNANVSSNVNVNGVINVNNLLIQGDNTNAYLRPINASSTMYIGANNQNFLSITSIGTVNVNTGNLLVARNIFANSGTITGSLLTGTITTNAQPNITSVGTLTSLNVSGSITAASGTITGSLLTGTITTNAQPNITAVGTLTSLAVTGNISASTSNIQLNSIGVGIAASGTNGEIRATNNISAYYASDKRLKENVIPIADAINKVNKISGVEFDWTKEYIESYGGEDGYFVRKHDIGVIAQEIQQVLPEAVAERTDGILAVKYERIVPLLIEAIKQQQQQIEKLHNMISGSKS